MIDHLKNSNKLNLLIVGPLNFPRGSASSSRVSAYGKGVMENGGHVTIMCYRPIGLSLFGETEIPASSVHEGIKYIYTSGITLRPVSFLRQLYYEIKGVLGAFYVIAKMHKNKELDVIMFYGYDTLMGGLFSLWAHLLGIPIIEEKCEYQFLNRQQLWNKIRAFMYERFVVPVFDGMLIMTNSLENHYRPLMRKDAAILRIPILIDKSRFDNLPQDNPDKSIAYCGDPTGNKDGVPILLGAFAKISPQFPDYKLYIVGASDKKKQMESLKSNVAKLNLEDKVIFTGKLPPSEVPVHLMRAAVLALARPTSIQASYGFPTKLGEYLMTGRPVVITNVGEICEFLIDGENAFISEPDSVDGFAEKLYEVLSNYDRAELIGHKGRQTAKDNFLLQKNGKRLYGYLCSLVSHYQR